jgi:hypothetical protein
MTHEASLALLLASTFSGDGPPTTERAAALAHVADCSDCWAVVRMLYELSNGAPPPDDARMGALTACDAVQSDLYLLVGLDAAAIRQRHPAMVRHLGWCHACRERLGDILVVERSAARGDFGGPVLASPAPRWREIAGRAGEVARELVEKAVVHVGRTAAGFAVVPQGFVVSATVAPGGALRGAAVAEAPSLLAPGLGRQVQFALGDSGVWAELTIEPEGGDQVSVALSISSAEPVEATLHLRELRGDRADLIARHTVVGTAPVVVKGLRPGRYVLEIHQQPKALLFKLRFDVERAM